MVKYGFEIGVGVSLGTTTRSVIGLPSDVTNGMFSLSGEIFDSERVFFEANIVTTKITQIPNKIAMTIPA